MKRQVSGKRSDAAWHYELRFDHSFMANAAAVEGIGIVLKSKLLVEREIASGNLVCPLISSSSEIHYAGHYLVLAPISAYACFPGDV